jgi:mutator protein MutT
MKQPNILYTAVKALIKNDEGKVLILKQSDTTISGGNQYHPPGGIVELGESLAECVVREIEEEIGVKSTVVRLFDIGEWRAERGSDIMQFIGLFYVCTIASDNFVMQAEEISEIRWVGLNEIDSIGIVEPSKSIIKSFLVQ